MPPLVTWRVVSSPPTRRSSDSITISCRRGGRRRPRRAPARSRGRRPALRGGRRSSRRAYCVVLAERGAAAATRAGSPFRDRACRPTSAADRRGPRRDAEHVADHDHRQRRGEVAHEVTLALLAHAVDQVVADRAMVRLAGPQRAGVKPRLTSLRRLSGRARPCRSSTAAGPSRAGCRRRSRRSPDRAPPRPLRRTSTMPQRSLLSSKWTGACRRIQAYARARAVDVEVQDSRLMGGAVIRRP